MPAATTSIIMLKNVVWLIYSDHIYFRGTAASTTNSDAPQCADASLSFDRAGSRKPIIALIQPIDRARRSCVRCTTKTCLYASA